MSDVIARAVAAGIALWAKGSAGTKASQEEMNNRHANRCRKLFMQGPQDDRAAGHRTRSYKPQPPRAEEQSMLKSALSMIAGIAIGLSANAVLAQSSVPYYLVAAINVKDEKAYEDSGVEKVRNAITGLTGGKLIAGGYNKATVLDGTLDANRFLIFKFADKATLHKAWTEHIKPWQTSEHVRKLADFHTISVEGVEQK